MAKTLKQILNLLLLLCLVACSERNDVSSLLSEAEMSMNERPDCALSLLDSLIHPEGLSPEQQALWCLLYTQAQDKNRIEHISDSLIQIAVRYYEKTDLEDRKMLAYYYCGRVFQDLNDALQAQEYYLKAYEVGKKLNVPALQGRLCANLGSLYTYQELYRPALDFQKEAVGYFIQDEDTVSLSLTLRNIARIHVCENRLDSAITYYSKALAYTSDFHKFYIFNELADSYGKIGDYQKGLFYAKEAYARLKTTNDSYLVSLALGDLFLKMEKNDSAYVYLSFCKNSSNIYTLAEAYYFLAQLEKRRNNLSKYVAFQEKYEILRDSIDKNTHTEMLYRQQCLYDYQLVEKEKEYYRQTVDKKTGVIYWGLLAVICFSVLAVGLFVVQDNKKRKKEEQLNLSLRIKEQEYSESQRYLQDTRNFANRLKKRLELELLKRVSVVKDLKNQLDRRLQEEINGKVKLQSELHQVQQDKVKIEERLKRVFDMVKINKGRQAKKQHIDLEKGKALFFNSDLYHGLYSEWTKIKSDQWVDLIDWIDHLLFIDFTHRIKNLYPGISEVELSICYLIKLSIPVGRIATLLSLSSQAISVNKKRLYAKLTRKQGSAKDFDEFILTF